MVAAIATFHFNSIQPTWETTMIAFVTTKRIEHVLHNLRSAWYDNREREKKKLKQNKFKLVFCNKIVLKTKSKLQF